MLFIVHNLKNEESSLFMSPYIVDMVDVTQEFDSWTE